MDNTTISTIVPFITEVTQEQIVTSVVIGSLLLLLVVLNVIMFVLYRLSMRSRKPRGVGPMGTEGGVGGVLLLQVNPAAAALVTRDSIVDLVQPLHTHHKTSTHSSSNECDPDLRKYSTHTGSHDLKVISHGQNLTDSSSYELDHDSRKSRIDHGSQELKLIPQGQEKAFSSHELKVISQGQNYTQSSSYEFNPDFRNSNINPGRQKLKVTQDGQERVSDCQKESEISRKNSDLSNERRQTQCDVVGGKSSSDTDNQINASIKVKAEVEIKSTNSDFLAERKCLSASLCQIQERGKVLLDVEKCVSRSMSEIRYTETAPSCDEYVPRNVSEPNMKDSISSSKDRVISGNVGQMKIAFHATIKDEDISKSVSAIGCSDNACLITDETIPISERKTKAISSNISPKDATTSNSVSKTQRNDGKSFINADHVSQDDNKEESVSGGSRSRTHRGSSTKRRHVSGSVSESDFENDSTDDLQFIDDMHSMCDDALDKRTKLQLPVAEFHNDSFEMKEAGTLSDLHDVNDIEL